eukprot:362555-Chlamydomonas_euryale.AAC.17
MACRPPPPRPPAGSERRQAASLAACCVAWAAACSMWCWPTCAPTPGQTWHREQGRQQGGALHAVAANARADVGDKSWRSDWGVRVRSA